MQYVFVGSNYNIIWVFDKEGKTEMKHLVLIMSTYTVLLFFSTSSDHFFFFLAQAQIMGVFFFSTSSYYGWQR